MKYKLLNSGILGSALLALSPLALGQSVSFNPTPATITPPATSVAIAVDFVSNGAVSGCTVVVDYDETIVDVTTCDAATGNAPGGALVSCTDDTPAAGQLTMSWVQLGVIMPDVADIVNLTFSEVGGGVTAGSSTPLDILEADVNNECVDTIGTAVTATFNDGAIDKPAVPEITITATDAAANETGPDAGQFTITATPAPAADLTVACTFSGTAADPADYSPSVTCPVTVPTTGSVTVDITPVDDALPEGDETVILTIDADPAYTVGTPSTDTVTITDNEPVITITATDAAAAEAGADPGQFTITATPAPAADLTVACTFSGTATDPADYSPSVTCPVTVPTTGSVTVDITPVDDVDIEGPETVILTIDADPAYTVGTPSTDTVTIADDEAAPPSAIPTLSQWGIILMSGLLGFATLLAGQRRRC